MASVSLPLHPQEIDATSLSPNEQTRKPSFWHLTLGFTLVWLFSTGLFMGIVAWLDNTSINTTNGHWKSLLMVKWVQKSQDRWLDHSNLIYFPLNARLIKLLPGKVFGPVWKRMAYLNTIFAGLALGSLYLLMRGLRAGTMATLAAVVFQAGCAFFLTLAVNNEDIMPSVAFGMLAVALAVHLFPNPTAWRMAIVAQPFAISWMYEWRVLFPALPAFALAILALPGSLGTRLKRFIAFLGGCLVLPVLMEQIIPLITPNHTRILLYEMLWTGKGIGTGWAGFQWNKWVYLLGGLEFYIYKGLNIGDWTWIVSKTNYLPLIIVCSLIATLGCLFTGICYFRRQDLAWRTAAIVLIVTFLCGQFFNLYSQPQDPQMQLTVMFWLAVAWGAVCIVGIPWVRRIPALNGAVLLMLSCVPLVLNLMHLKTIRGDDGKVLANLREVQTHLDPAKTVFITHGWEGINTWKTVVWGQPPYLPFKDGFPHPTTAYKPIYLVSWGAEAPNATPEEAVARLENRIQAARNMGYTVAINQIWDFSEQRFVDSWGTLSANPEVPRALHRTLKEKYKATLILNNPNYGPYYLLVPKDNSPS